MSTCVCTLLYPPAVEKHLLLEEKSEPEVLQNCLPILSDQARADSTAVVGGQHE